MMKNQQQKERDKSDFHAARQAVVDFRDSGDIRNFENLERWLRDHVWRGNRKADSSYHLNAFGRYDLGLTAEEYNRMEKAYKASLIS